MNPSAVHTAREVRIVLGRLRRRLRQSYDSRDLTASQTALLSRLDREGPRSASELAAAERVRPQSVATSLAVLEERGMVERRRDPADGRRQVVSLTPGARTFLDTSRAAGEEWLARALAEHLDADERRTVVAAMALLDRVACA